MTVRCKFVCYEVTKRQQYKGQSSEKGNIYEFVYDASFQVVHGDCEENKKFFASTPTGKIVVQTLREDTFEPGKSYYVDFTAAD